MILNLFRACISIVWGFFKIKFSKRLRDFYNCIISQKANIQPYLRDNTGLYFINFLLSGNAVNKKKIYT